MRLQNEVLLRLTLSSSFLFFSFFSFLFFLNDAPARMQDQSQSTQVYIHSPPCLDERQWFAARWESCTCCFVLSTTLARRRDRSRKIPPPLFFQTLSVLEDSLHEQ